MLFLASLLLFYCDSSDAQECGKRKSWILSQNQIVFQTSSYIGRDWYYTENILPEIRNIFSGQGKTIKNSGLDLDREIWQSAHL